MKTKLKIATLTIVTSFLTMTSFSQISGGAHTNFTKYLGDYGYKSLGLGVSGEYSPDEERSSIRGSFTFGLPSTTTFSTYLSSGSNMVPSTQITVTQKTSFMQLWVDYKFYLGGNSSYDDGGFYLFGGLGLTMASAKYTPSAYNTDLYSYDDSPERVFQPILRFGPGFELPVAKGYLYGEGYLNLPANRANGVEIEVNIPLSVGLQVGYRLPF